MLTTSSGVPGLEAKVLQHGKVVILPAGAPVAEHVAGN